MLFFITFKITFLGGESKLSLHYLSSNFTLKSLTFFPKVVKNVQKYFDFVFNCFEFQNFLCSETTHSNGFVPK